MMYFCPRNLSLGEPWLHKGFNPCFITTTASSILFGIIFLGGGVEFYIYRKYSNSVDSRLRPRSCLYKLQVFLTILMCLQSAALLALQKLVLEDKTLYIYLIVSGAFGIAMWPLSLVLLHLERNKVLPSIPSWGHGLVLLLFWTLAFANENLAFISWESPLWWWGRKR